MSHISLPSLQDISTQRDGTINSTTSSLHAFIREAFPGALMLEEHQVLICVNVVCGK